jgi:peroxiredoxin Q/BCP
MQLQRGQIAPNFTVKDINDTVIALDDYKNKKLLICFFRYAGCPFCNLMLHSFIERYPKLHQNGLEVVAFIQSPRKAIMEYPMQRQTPKPPFPIIADAEQVIYKLYDVDVSAAKFAKGLVKAPKLLSELYRHHFPQGKIDGKLLLMPAFFLVGPTAFQIHEAYYSPDFSTMIPDVDIVDFIFNT